MMFRFGAQEVTFEIIRIKQAEERREVHYDSGTRLPIILENDVNCVTVTNSGGSHDALLIVPQVRDFSRYEDQNGLLLSLTALKLFPQLS